MEKTDKTRKAINTIKGICESDLQLTNEGIEVVCDSLVEVLTEPIYLIGTKEQKRHERLKALADVAIEDNWTVGQIRTMARTEKMTAVEIDRYIFGR